MISSVFIYLDNINVNNNPQIWHVSDRHCARYTLIYLLVSHPSDGYDKLFQSLAACAIPLDIINHRFCDMIGLKYCGQNFDLMR